MLALEGVETNLAKGGSEILESLCSGDLSTEMIRRKCTAREIPYSVFRDGFDLAILRDSAYLRGCP